VFRVPSAMDRLDSERHLTSISGCGKRGFLSEFPLGAPISTISERSNQD
jgi:hypothetical protein